MPLCGGACGGAAEEGGSDDEARGPLLRMRKPFVAPPFQERPGMKTFYNVPEGCPVNCFARRARW